MASTALEKLNKVLALADSGHDGEAMAALRAARNMLTNDGVSLSHVLQSAIAERRPEVVQVRGGVVTALQKEVIQLQMQLAKAQRDLREQMAESQHWKRQAEDNARKYKKLAVDVDLRQRRMNEAARNLADIAKSIESFD
ncbi:MAG: DUF2786 domain-containing protein [Alphaproteobacteria bacterium]|nr:DUF2786 domain-containing protein [Alphaproteobacteria bacterium]